MQYSIPEEGDVADALTFHDGGLSVRHACLVLHGRQTTAAHDAVDLVKHLLLDVSMQDHEEEAPLEGGRHRLAARDEQVLDGAAEVALCRQDGSITTRPGNVGQLVDALIPFTA